MHFFLLKTVTMQKHLKVVILAIASIAISFSMATAQVLPLDNFGIFPPGGAPFNPFGKFASIGESGGAQGPTANGCDLYGFRAQIDTFNAVSLGIQNIPRTRTPFSPVLSFESIGSTPFYILQQDARPNGTSGATFGCGKVLATYNVRLSTGGPISRIPFVYNIFGSALATGGNWVASDKTLKRDIQPIKNAMEIVQKLNGVNYAYRADERPELNLNQGREFGFLTQEVKEIIPEAVATPPGLDGEAADFDAMNYNMIIPILTEAIKIQQDEIDAQNDEISTQREVIKKQQDAIETLAARLREIEEKLGIGEARASSPSNASGIANDNIMLGQNRPNPTSGLTMIDYSLTDDVQNAQLVIYDASGRAVKRFALENGVGSVEYNTNELTSGIYFYTIESNGSNLARQKMVVK